MPNFVKIFGCLAAGMEDSFSHIADKFTSSKGFVIYYSNEIQTKLHF